MELSHLRTFRAVVRHRTVTRAAAELDLAPSSVSAHIRALETSLGVPLFDRTPQGMRPTPAGDRMTVWARRLLDDAERAAADVAGHRAAVRLGALETIAATCVPAVLARLADRRPGLAVEVRAATRRDELLAAVVAGDLAAALLLDTGDALGDLGFAAPAAPLAHLDVGTVPLALVAAPGHPLAARDTLAPADLAGERLLVNAAACSFRMAADHLIGTHATRVHAGGVPVMRAWAGQGLGIALLPRFAVDDALRAGTLVRLPLPAPDLALRLVWHGEHESAPATRDLLYAAAAVAGG
ncbi:LysR family transcriptional regulator [Streptomyces sp. RFCAC02]|uniref:LysR family transcriptional regulator n=1 Tax=Streptomyces sp. RFCAC02 TaxID=2499143 RepID=UPI00101F54C2|nr:LysR family transcriptional regulator [Streptomyces sp. RFCAC02]